MAHFAFVNGGIVEKVIVAEQDFVDSHRESTPGKYIQTSYNTFGGTHLLGGIPLRKNFAQVGGTYDPVRDAFIPMKPYPSWTLNESTCRWECPVSYPDDGKVYDWDETSKAWKER